MDNNINLKSCTQIENAEHLSLEELAGLINNSFLEPMEFFSPLNPIDHIINNSRDQISVLAMPWSTFPRKHPDRIIFRIVSLRTLLIF